MQDGDGRRLLGVTSVQALSETDLMRNATFVMTAGRTIRVTQPLDEIVVLVAGRASPAGAEGGGVAVLATSC
jgi:hypothetical protein